MTDMGETRLSDLAFSGLLSDLDISLSDHPTRHLNADEEFHVDALLMWWRSIRSATPGQYTALESLYERHFTERPWYHRLPVEVLLGLMRGEPVSDFFYAQIWLGNSSIRDWINEVAWLLRDDLELWPTIRNMSINIEFSQYGLWIAHLWWLIERHPEVPGMLERMYPFRYPDWYRRRLPEFFEEGPGDWPRWLNDIEHEVLEVIYKVAARTGHTPDPFPSPPGA